MESSIDRHCHGKSSDCEAYTSASVLSTCFLMWNAERVPPFAGVLRKSGDTPQVSLRIIFFYWLVIYRPYGSWLTKTENGHGT